MTFREYAALQRVMICLCFVAVFPSFLLCYSSLTLFVFGNCLPFSELNFHVVVSTKMGFAKGEVVDLNVSDVEKVFTKFLGIPYAEPPVGELRFERPLKHYGWIKDGVFDATVLKPRCRESELIEHYKSDELNNGVTVKNFSLENCLFLNIYVPDNLSLNLAMIDAMELPVLVMLTDDEEDRDTSVATFGHLASYCKAIVVDISYRSGFLSYLTIMDSEFAFGNNGFYDQNLALRWLWDNIREFGGSPEKITVFAESDASFDLGYHILRPETRIVISKAIMHSGTILTPGYFQKSIPDISSLFSKAISFYCNSTITVVKCLQSLSFKQLLAASDRVWKNFGSWRRCRFYQQHLSLQPLDFLSDEHFSRIDLLIGLSKSDGSCLLKKILNTEIVNNLSEENLKTILRGFLKFVYEDARHSDKILETVLGAVLFEYSNCGSLKQNVTRFLNEVIIDMMFHAPAELTARLASNQENNVYLYFISSENYDCKGIKSLIRFEEDRWNSGQKLKNSVGDMLMNFVKNGNPNPLKELPDQDWKPFSEANRNTVLMTDESIFLLHNIQQRKMAFWNNYFPYLLQSDSDSCFSSSDFINSTLTNNLEKKDFLWLLGGLVGSGIVLFLMFLWTVLCFHFLRSSKKLKYFGECCHKECSTDHSLMMASTSDEVQRLHPLPYSDEL